MIRVINSQNRHAHGASLEQMFRLRHAVFVNELRWRAGDHSQREADEYDNDRATYLACIDACGDVIGSIRLCPTTQPYMMMEHFADMIDGAHIERSDVLEASRYVIARDHRHGSGVYLELFLGMIEHGLSEGVVGIIALMRTMKISQLLQIGMAVRPLGLSKSIGGEHNTAVLYGIDSDVLARVRQSARVSGPVLEDATALSRVA